MQEKLIKNVCNYMVYDSFKKQYRKLKSNY